MTALGLGLVGASVLAMPADGATARRLRSISVGARPDHTPPPGERRRPRWVLVGLRTRARPGPLGAVAAVVGVLAAGPAVGLAAAVTALLVTRLMHGRLAARRQRHEVDAMVEALAALTGELRAGGTPEAALRAGAAVAAGAAVGGAGSHPPPPGGLTRPTWAVLDTAAATASLGGDVGAALATAAAECAPGLGGPLRRISAGWQVSERSGAPLGSVLARVEDDLRASRRHARQLDAQLAGPRATGMLLALLPVLGIALGVAMGAHPLGVLVHTGAGQLALVVGVGLDAVGVLWTARLLRAGGP